MHWFIGIFIGILVCILGYLIYAYICTKNQNEEQNQQNNNQQEYQLTPNLPIQNSSIPSQIHPVQMTQMIHPTPPNIPNYLPPLNTSGSSPLNPPLNPSQNHLKRKIQSSVTTPIKLSKQETQNKNTSNTSNTWTMKNQEIRKLDNRLDQDELVDPPVPEVETYNEIRTFEMSSLPHVASSLGIRNCVAVELVKAVIPKGEYTVTSTENTLQIRATTSPASSFIDVTLNVGDYNISTLAAEIQSKVRAAYSATFTVTYVALTSTIRFSDAGAAFDGILHTQLAYMLGFPSATFASSGGGNTVVGTNRVDIFGNRKVQIRTLELDGPDGHYNGIMESIHLPSDLTEWVNTSPIELTLRKFQHPRAIDQLTLSIKTRHPSQSLETDFLELDLNGVEASLTVCFQCLRYKNVTMDKALQIK
jgi:hypothetical protein